MKEVYRIKKGEIKCNDFSINFEFGIVLLDKGIFYFDLYFNEKINLYDYMNDTSKEMFYKSFEGNCLTEDGARLSVTELSATQIDPSKCKIVMICYGAITHEEISLSMAEPSSEDKVDNRDPIYFLEVEGLQMEHTDITEIHKSRNGEEILNYNSQRDYTSAMLVYRGSNNSSCTSFNLLFLKNEIDKNLTIIQFKGDYSNLLYYDVFIEFREDFIHLLSLLNGAEVKIRKEFTGEHFSVSHFRSQKMITYSFEPIINERFSHYVPINSPFKRGDRIISKVLMFSFDKYVKVNRTLDLNSIIFYLNGAEKASSIMEKFFIKMVAFERLADINFKLNSGHTEYLIENDQKQMIAGEIALILKKYSREFKFDFTTINSRVDNLFKKSNGRTEKKLYYLLETAKIEINDDIKMLIEKVRNNIIHEGTLQTNRDNVKFYFLLDKLLRDIILNLIEYNGPREDRRNWFI